MRLIELHYKKTPYSVNADYITEVIPRKDRCGCRIYLSGEYGKYDSEADESYEEVLRLINGGRRSTPDYFKNSHAICHAICIADYAADEHPYDKDPARPDTFSDYNQGWHDACDYIRDKLERIVGKEGVDNG